MTRPVAYLTGEYPRATDTFIQREVAALRAHGLKVETCSIRRTGDAHLVGPEQREEAARTFYTLAAAKNPVRLMMAHLGWLMHAPGRYLSASRLAWKTAPGGFRGALFQAFYFAEAAVLAAHLRRINARHLHNHIASAAGTVAMLAAEMAGIPFSFTLHGPDIFYTPHHWRLDEKIKRAAFVACISNFARAQAMNLSGRSHWDKLHIVHCGVEPARYERKGPSGKRLLFVGRLAAVKGVPLLLEALRQIKTDQPEVHLTLIGDGPERMGLEKEAARLGLSDTVTFAGYQSQDDVAAALSSSDIFVLPSFAEGVPVVLMEAMATGLPVIATAVGGVGELVRDGESGLILPPGDVAALAAALKKLLADPAQCHEMGKVGAKTVAAGFDSQTEAGKLAALLMREGTS
ncbi:MAG: glycosyltransferase family 4 protein [Alphaproteobacteria bacterium]|nr:glycosyltransferase family 4 protein [Alphaproteobacteria bacterium]